MPRKKQSFQKKFFRIQTFLLFGTVAFIILMSLTAFLLNSRIQTKPEATQSANLNQASPSASIKPTPTPLPIPKHSGKQVRVPILMYHYVGNNPNPLDKARDNLSVSPDKFDEQMGYLSSQGFTPITLNTLYSSLREGGGLPAKPVILTFDDGYTDFYYNAFPILKKYGFSATVFIPTALMDQGYYLTWAQIKEMSSSGLVSFESHSVNHSNLVSLSSENLTFQLIESKKVLEAQLGKPVNFIAYPFGFSDERVWQATQKAGYKGATGTWFGNIQSEGTLYNMARVKIPGGIDIQAFASRL